MPRPRISAPHRPIPNHIPATLRPCTHPIQSSLSLQIGHFGAIAQLAERLDRTQEVGGSNPPSSIDEEALQTGIFVSGRLVLTASLIDTSLGTSAQRGVR